MKKCSKVVYVTAVLTCQAQRILRLLCLFFLRLMMTTNIMSCPTSGFPKIIYLSVSSVTMCRMTFGSGKAFCKPLRGMSCITVTSRSLSNGSVNASISEKSPLTGGELCRWCRTLRVWALPLFRLDKDLRICHRRPRN